LRALMLYAATQQDAVDIAEHAGEDASDAVRGRHGARAVRRDDRRRAGQQDRECRRDHCCHLRTNEGPPPSLEAHDVAPSIAVQRRPSPSFFMITKDPRAFDDRILRDHEFAAGRVTARRPCSQHSHLEDSTWRLRTGRRSVETTRALRTGRGAWWSRAWRPAHARRRARSHRRCRSADSRSVREWSAPDPRCSPGGRPGRR